MYTHSCMYWWPKHWNHSCLLTLNIFNKVCVCVCFWCNCHEKYAGTEENKVEESTSYTRTRSQTLKMYTKIVYKWNIIMIGVAAHTNSGFVFCVLSFSYYFLQIEACRPSSLRKILLTNSTNIVQIRYKWIFF